jgi:hypothetical protein
MKNLLRTFNAKVGSEDIFKSTVGYDSLHEISNDNRSSIGNFAIIKKPAYSTMLTHGNIHKHTLNSPDRKTHN